MNKKLTDFTIIGISGTDGSGKDTLGHLLEDRFKYKFVSITESLRDEAKNRGEELSRETLHNISEEWRNEHGYSVLVDKAIEIYESFKFDHEGLAMASLRHPYEADRIHELGGVVVWVDADPEIRYARITFSDRGREAEDNKSYEEFINEEKQEMTQHGSEASLNMLGVKEKADIELFNNSTELDHFIRTIDESLKPYL